MLQKVNFKRFMLLAAILLILPLALSARGTTEADKNKGLTLDLSVSSLLDRIEEGSLTLEDAKDEFMTLEKSFQVSVRERNMIYGMMEDVAKGEKKAEDCDEPLKDQLQTRTRITTQEQVKETTQDQLKTGTGTGSKK